MAAPAGKPAPLTLKQKLDMSLDDIIAHENALAAHQLGVRNARPLGDIPGEVGALRAEVVSLQSENYRLHARLDELEEQIGHVYDAIAASRTGGHA